MNTKEWMTPRNIKIAVITAAVVVITYALGFSWHQSVSVSREKIDVLGGILRENVVEQAEVLGRLTQMGVAAIPDSQPILQDMDAVLQQSLAANTVEKPWQAAETMAAFCQSEAAVEQALTTLQNQLKQYPQIVQSKQYVLYQEHIQAIRAQIAFGKGALAQEAKYYNVTLKDIPGRWFNDVFFHYKPISVCAISP